MKNNRNKTMGHVPNGYLVQLIREHKSGSSEIRTHDGFVGWVKSANLNIMTDDEIVIARAKMLEDVGNEKKEDHDDGVENTVDSEPTVKATAASASAPSEAGEILRTGTNKRRLSEDVEKKAEWTWRRVMTKKMTFLKAKGKVK